MKKNLTRSSTRTCKGNENCWCFNYPTILPANDSKNCLSEEELKSAIHTEIDRIVSKFKKTGVNEATKFKDLRVQEHFDYTIGKSGFWIFTSWYLLRRGYCCDNGCLHCPY